MKNDSNYFQPRSNVKRTQKTYLVTKLPDNSPLRNELKSSFEDVDKYLKVDNRIIIGNQQFQYPRRTENYAVIPWSIIGPTSMYDETDFSKMRKSTFQFSRISNNTMTSIKREEKPKNIVYELIDDNKLKYIFQEYENRCNSPRHQNDFMDSLPLEIGHKLNNQEKSLFTHSLEEKRFTSMAKYLSDKTKKNEKDLLMNKFYKIGEKKQILAHSDKYIPFDQRYVNHTWEISLRRPKNFKGTRNSYINLGDTSHPIWQLVKETVPDPIEIVSKPTEKEENKNNRKNGKIMEATLYKSNIGKNLETIERLKDIEVKGKNLLKYEIESSKYLSGKKILYKKEFFDTPYNDTQVSFGNNNASDASKLTKLSTLPKIYYENYNGSNLNRSNR